jgi:hypothetical protein
LEHMDVEPGKWFWSETIDLERERWCQLALFRAGNGYKIRPPGKQAIALLFPIF